ncbi:MAG: hypothetical protein IIU49_04320 [Spirochaetales bacterium]|nr:hypothetical protein [Spirochaetales bacterium]
MRHIRPVLIVILLLICCTGAFASFGMRPYVSGWFGASLCHGTAQYMQKYPGDDSTGTPFFRTSYDFGFDAQLLEAVVSVGNEGAITFGAGASYLNVSQSLAYGRSILKPYSGLGLCADLGYRFNAKFDINLKYRYLYCSYTGTSASFIVQDFEIVPGYAVASQSAMDICVSLPLTISYKADAVSIRAGISVIIALDSRRVSAGKEGGQR